jgi:hypothetical protein
MAEGAPGVPVDALVIAAIVVINAVVGLLQERRVEDAVAALADLTTASSTVLRDGRLTTVTSRDLVVGDVLVLTEGDAVGADARLLEAVGLRVQEASLTGESAAVVKDPATLAAPAALGDRVNLVFRGTGVVQGVGRAVVIATGMDTQVGAIAAMLEATETERSPLRKEIAEVGRHWDPGGRDRPRGDGDAGRAERRPNPGRLVPVALLRSRSPWPRCRKARPSCRWCSGCRVQAPRPAGPHSERARPPR